MGFGVGVADGRVELLDPFFIRWEWGQTMRHRVGSFHPCCDVLAKDLFNKCFDVKFNVVASLNDVDAVV